MAHQQQQKMYDLYAQGLTLRQIAASLNLHHKTISKYLKQMGVEITNRGNTGRTNCIEYVDYKTTVERDNLIISQYQEGAGSPTIAKCFNISKATVLRVLRKNKIKRTNSFAKPKPPRNVVKQQYKSGLSIGKIANKHGVPDYVIAKSLGDIKRTPGETMSLLRGIEPRIIKLYQDGLSTYDIADILGLSHPESIRRLLKKSKLIRPESEVRKLTALKLASSTYRSRPEKKITHILKKLGVDFVEQFPLEGWNFDFKIGNLLLEIQSYWHLLPKRVQRDRKKAALAKALNYKTIYLWEHQLKNTQFVEEFLSYKLGLKKTIDFDFNNIVIKKDRVEAQKLMQWHYHQKTGRYGHEYVAYLGKTPIATCIFASIIRHQIAKKQKVSHTAILELTRFVIHPNYHKKNFGSWLIARCVKLLRAELPHLEKLISFSDTTYNHCGGIYRASNWKLDGEIPSDYWYVTPTRSVKHKKTVWNAAKKEELTESKYAAKYRLQKVFGLPKYRFIKSL